MLQAIAVAVLVLYAAIAWLIFRVYRHTRSIGFLIIGCGILVWPLVGSRLMRIVTDTFLMPGNLWGELLLAQTGKVIQAGLILIGFIAIERAINVTYPRIARDQR
jgi:hypothetical protein